MSQLTDEELRKVLGKNLKLARQSVSLTQDSLAEISGISLNFLKEVEGCRSGVSLVTLVNICRSLEITPNILLKDFFVQSSNEVKNLVQEISLLNEYQKDAVYSLINFFKNNDMP